MTITDDNASAGPVAGNAQSAIAALRRFARPRPPAERCELCAAPLGPQHSHLLQRGTQKLLCACDACALLFSDSQAARFQRIPRRIEFWPNFRMSDAQWDALGIPITLAFLFQRAPETSVVAMYPSPGGATESMLPIEAWQLLVDENPVLAQLEPNVEVLLINRIGGARDYYRAPIDECYKLVGLVRTHWRGLSGGPEIWGQIARFFDDLKSRSIKAQSHA